MAKKRRSYQINSGDYNVAGGGGGAASGNVRFMRKDTQAVSIGGVGEIYTPGTKNVPNPIKINVEAGLAVSTAVQTESYVIFEHAFEAPNASVAMVSDADELPTGYAATVPSGLSINTNSDQGDGNYGYVQFATNTISSSATAGKYKFRYYVDQGGWSRSYIDYEVDVWPQGTTPVWNSTSVLLNRIIKDQTGKQYLTDTVTASQAVAFSLANVSGFPTGYELKVEGTDAGANAGRAYVENTPNTSHASAPHSFDIVVDLGQYGSYTQSFSNNITYGDAYGSRYFGPANSYRNWNNGDYTSSSDPTQVDGTYWFSPNQNSGALKCQNRGRDSSPYGVNDGYGCNYNFSNALGTSNINSTSGTMSSYTQGYYLGSNDSGVRFKWTVPNGVTSFCVAGISGGCHGGQSWANDGGGSGALAYVNGVTCTPGEEFIVRIGMGRNVTSQSTHWAGDTYMQRVSNSEWIIYCYGAGYSGRQSNLGGSATWSYYNYTSNQMQPGAAWATNAYTSQGAYHGGWSNSYNHGAGTAGWRDTGTGGSNSLNSTSGGGARNGRGYSSTYGGSAGGGTGLDGNGVGVQDFGFSYGSADNNSDTNTDYGMGSHGWRYGGGGGSGGTRGCYGENPYTGSGYSSQGIQGGMHGGGGGGAGSSWGSGPGGPGGLRIIWGTGRAYPNTYTTENPSITNQS